MCSAITNYTNDNKYFFGRNLDFNRITEGTGIIYIPRNYKYYVVGSQYENNLEEENSYLSKYKVLGIGTNVLAPTMALYDGVNEKGLVGAQLYFRGYAHFLDEVKSGTYPIQAAYLIVHLLSSCKDVSEVIDTIKNKVSLISKPLLGSTPTLHFIFSDKVSSVVVEYTKDGLKIYQNNLGILTNSPEYSYHITNLSNYMNLRNEDYDDLNICDISLKQTYSGNGLVGLPGDFSSPSRFIRLAFLKKYLDKGEGINYGVTSMFNALSNVAFPKGLVMVTDHSNITVKDKDISPYDYTIYSVVYDLNSGGLYYRTYSNLDINFISINDFNTELSHIPLDFNPEFNKIER